MKRTSIVLALLSFALMLMAGSAMAADEGKTIFTENKCNKCHSVDAAGIKRLEEPKAGKKAPPDLSGTGHDGDAAWIADFLMKIEKSKSKSNKRHQKKFAGSPEQLTTLSNWLAGLKTGDAPSKLVD